MGNFDAGTRLKVNLSVIRSLFHPLRKRGIRWYFCFSYFILLEIKEWFKMKIGGDGLPLSFRLIIHALSNVINPSVSAMLLLYHRGNSFLLLL